VAAPLSRTIPCECEEAKGKGRRGRVVQIAIDNGNYSNRLAVQAIKELGHQAVVPLMSCVKAYYRINANLSFEDIATAFSGVGAGDRSAPDPTAGTIKR